MNIWFKLTPEEVEDFQVPSPVANAAENQFYSTAPLTNLYFDGPWLLLSFQQHAQRPFVVTFQPCAIEFCFINEFDAFNPLSEAGSGTLTLSRQELHGLIDLLTMLAAQMPANEQHASAGFAQLDPDQWSNFHLSSSPNQLAHQKVFLQTRDPAADVRDATIVSLIAVETSPTQCYRRGFSRLQPQRFQIRLRQFSLEALNDPTFDPLANGKNKMELDRYSLLDLAMVLQSVLAKTAVATEPDAAHAPVAALHPTSIAVYMPA